MTKKGTGWQASGDDQKGDGWQASGEDWKVEWGGGGGGGGKLPKLTSNNKTNKGHLAPKSAFEVLNLVI